MTTINEAGLALIRKYEGFRSKPYICPAGIPTIGYGSTYYEDGNKVKLTDAAISEARANLMLKAHASKFASQVQSLVRVRITDNQLAALTSFAYNLGINALKNSTLLRSLNAGDFGKAADEFLKWDKATVNGKLTVLKGLSTRRKDERALFLA